MLKMMQMVSGLEACLKHFFSAGLAAVQPEEWLGSHIQVDDDGVTLLQRRYSWTSIRYLRLIAIGKAAYAGALAVEQLLGHRLHSGICITKHGHAGKACKSSVYEAGHPYPDQASIAAADALLAFTQDSRAEDLWLALISGGASALIADLPPDISLDDLAKVNQNLVNSGWEIRDINAVRKHLSILKGGQLAARLFPASVVGLLVSDVPDDDPAVIGSGLLAADHSSFDSVCALLRSSDLWEQLPSTVTTHLQRGAAGMVAETLKAKDERLKQVQQQVVATNTRLMKTVASAAEAEGFVPLCTKIPAGCTVVELKDTILHHLSGTFCVDEPKAFIYGGETTVQVTGHGLGGRNQHLALWLLHDLLQSTNRYPAAAILCAGTDGTDGPTHAAGAWFVFDPRQPTPISQTETMAYLHDFDAFHFFEKHGGLLITGPTGTNVMDIIIVLAFPDSTC